MEHEAVDLIEFLVAAYPKQAVQPRTIAVYAKMIEPFDRTEAEAAVLHIVATSTFFPAIAEIRTAIAEGRTEAPAWEEAWEEVCRLRKLHGSYVGPQWGRPFGWSDPLIDQALRTVGGYEAVCRVEFKDEPTLRAQFRDVYQSLRKRVVTAAHLDGLPTGGAMAIEDGR
jgi:hypothetical protein